MKAKKITETNKIIELKDFISDVLNTSDDEKYKFILSNYDYIKNFIITEISISDPEKVVDNTINYNDETYDDIKLDAKQQLKSMLRDMKSKDICLSLNSEYEEFEDEDGNLTFKGYPSFLYYSKEILSPIKNKWLIYVGNNSLDMYQKNAFDYVIDDFNYIAPYVERTDETTHHCVCYNPVHFDKSKLSKYNTYMILFKGSGIELKNIYNYDAETDEGDYLQTIVDVDSVSNMNLIYTDNNTYKLFTGGKNDIAFNSLDELLSNILNGDQEYGYSYKPEHEHALNSINNNLIHGNADTYNDTDTFAHGSGGSKGMHSSKKPVTQLDPMGGSMKTWASATEASEELGIPRTSIVKAAKGQQSVAGGFKWKYA